MPIQEPDKPTKCKQVTWIDGDLLKEKNGTTLQNPEKATASAPFMDRLTELKWKFNKWLKKKENVKNKIRTLPKKRRKTFKLDSDDSQSEYSTASSQNTDYNESSDDWDTESDVELSEDPNWDNFMARLVAGHTTPTKNKDQGPEAQVNWSTDSSSC